MKASMTCLPILIVPNWNVEFHVHTDVSNFVLGVTLGKIQIILLINQYTMLVD